MSIHYGKSLLEMVQMQLYYISITAAFFFVCMNAACIFFGFTSPASWVLSGAGLLLVIVSYGISSFLKHFWGEM